MSKRPLNIVADGIGGGGDEVLGAHQAGEAGGGQAQDADEVGDFGEGVGGLAELDEAAGEDAQGGDLIVEAVEIGAFQVFQLGGLELAGVEAVADSVGVAGLGAAFSIDDF